MEYFDEVALQESLLLSMRWSVTKAEAEIVVSYAAEAVSAWFEARSKGVSLTDYKAPPRVFRCLLFTGVSELRFNSVATGDVVVSALARSPADTTIRSPILARVRDGFEFTFELGDQDSIRFTFREFFA